jgi:hypothetical protein
VKTFSGEIEKLYDKLIEGKPFAFSKYADGEWMAMTGQPLNNGEFESNHQTIDAIENLIESFTFKDAGYYVGVSCSCCQGENHQRMVEASGQDEEHLTFANIFVNSNYDFFLNKFLPAFKNHKVHLVANENSNIENLPFAVEKFYPVSFSAWVNNRNLVDDIKKENHSGKLFLFCCGPFGNILSQQLWKDNKTNIYMDIGSTLNPFLGSEGFRRSYFDPNSECRKQVCVWG